MLERAPLATRVGASTLRRTATTWPLVAALGFVAAPAVADDLERGEVAADALRNRAGVDYDFWPHRATAAVDRREPRRYAMSWTLAAQVRVARTIFLELELPFAFARQITASGAGSGAAVGSVVAGMHFGRRVTRTVSWYVGALLAAPTMLASTRRSGAAPDVGLMARDARARLDGHRFTIEEGAVRFRIGFESQPVPFVFVRMSFAHAIGIPLLSQTIEQVNELEARARFGLGSGIRLQEVFTLLEEDKAHTAIEPFVGYTAPRVGLYARAGLLVALDEKLGPGVDRGKVMSLRASLGAVW